MSGKVRFRRTAALLGALGLATTLAACGSSEGDTGGEASPPSEVRLGYFANVTHAPALIGVQNGLFEEELGDETDLTTTVFNAGPSVVEAIFADALDISFIGPNPAINAHIQSGGTGVRVVAGSTSGGASFITKPSITSNDQLKGTTIATPQLGNTQDVALRYWAQENNLTVTDTGAGDFAIVPTPNSESVPQFNQGNLDGAWVPEPHASRMVLDGGGHVFIDERDLWPDGEFITTMIIVRKAFLDQYPDTVQKILAAHIKAIQYIEDSPDEAKKTINDHLVALAGNAIPDAVLDRSLGQMSFTTDPLTETIEASAEHAVAVGLLDQAGVDAAGGFDGLVDLTYINRALEDAGLPTVKE